MMMLATPVLVWMLVDQMGRFFGIGALPAFLSVFRNHMIYMAQRAMGQRPEIPS